MSVLDWFRAPPVEAVDLPTTVNDVMATHNVEFGDGYMLAAPKVKVDEEIGYGGSNTYTLGLRREYNPELIGEQGIVKYMEMRNDAQVRASLRLLKTPIHSATWFVDPPTNDELDIEIADFISWNLFRGMSVSWTALIHEILFMLDYGRMTFEKVYEYKDWNGQKLIGWKKLSARHPLEEFEWRYDEKDGGPKSLRVLYDNSDGYVEIPIEKLAVFTFDMEGGDMRGNSILRSAYKNWFYKEQMYKIDAIQKERHAIGIPIVKLPASYTTEDFGKAHEIGMSLRTNESAHVVLDPQWEVFFAKLEGQPVDVLKSATMHGNMIYENVLGHFIVDVGSSKENTANQGIFVKATKSFADQITDVINHYCIPQIVDLNWANISRYPVLNVRKIGEDTDHRSISFALRNFVGASLVTPDDRLEDWLRKEVGLPRIQPSTARKVANPQNGSGAGKAGMPAQSTAKGQQVGVGNNKRVGKDVTGK